ncbi:MAG TPA: phosphoribosylformylglycinamidine synthase I [bacterium]
MTVKTLILKTAGINCDFELAHAFTLAGSETEHVHINELVRGEKLLSDFDILGFPGGFSYGDDLSAGRVLATEVRAHILDDIHSFYKNGGLIFGVCNGFQVLVKAKLLPDPEDLLNHTPPKSTLFWNGSGKFEDRWVTLRTEPESKCIWTKGYPEMIELPIAHAEGKFLVKNNEMLEKLKARGQIVFRYCDPKNADGCFNSDVPYPLNPNASTANIAGICDPEGRVLGLMPHPERFHHQTNHPRWTRRKYEESSIGVGESGGWADGLPLFKNAVDYVKDFKSALTK